MTYNQIRLVKRVLAAALLGFGALVAHELYTYVARSPDPVETGVAIPAEDPLARQIELTRLDSEGRKEFVLKAAESIGRSEQSQTFRDVELTFTAGRERTDLVITAETCRYNAADSSARFEGDVVVRSEDGLRLESAVLEYRRAPDRVWTEVPVRFSQDEWSGTADRFYYDVTSGRLELDDAARLTRERPGEEPLFVESRRAVFVRRRSLVRFIEDVAVRQGSHRLFANHLEVFLAEDESRVDRWEARENVRLFLDGWAEEDAGSTEGAVFRNPGRKTLLTDKLEGYVRPEAGTLERVRALEGGKLVLEPVPGAAPDQAVRRELEGHLLAFDFDSEGRLTALRARGGITLTLRSTAEPDEPPKRLTARQLEADFDPASGDLREARSSGSVELVQGEARATGDEGIYETASESLLLTGSPALRDPSASVEAKRIRIHVASGNIEAWENVRSTFRGERAGEKGLGFLAPEAGEPVHFVSDHLTYDRGAEIAVFTGTARGFQGASRIEAERLELRQKEGELAATDRVRTVLFPSSQGGAERPAPSITRAGSFLYRAEDRVLAYRDKVEMTSGDVTVRGNAADVLLDESGSEVLAIDTEGDVTIRTARGEAGGRTARYLPKSEEVQVSGAPAWMRDGDKLTQGKELTFFLTGARILVDGREESRTRTTYTSRPRP